MAFALRLSVYGDHQALAALLNPGGTTHRYLMLLKAEPAAADSTIASLTECTAYTRYDLGVAGFTIADTSGVSGKATATNTAAISIPFSGASGGPILAVAIVDVASGTAGNIIALGDVTDQTKNPTNGDTFNFAIGQLSIYVQ